MTRHASGSERRRPARTRLSSAATLLALGLAAAAQACGGGAAQESALPSPIDPQQVEDQDSMTWADYHPVPGVDWADSVHPQRAFRMALVAVDFPDEPFVITQRKHSDPFGNPQIDPIARDDVPQFYADFFLKPGAVNHGHTINAYWMEQSRGKFGITELKPFGPYRLPKPFWRYGLDEWGQNAYTPDGVPVEGREPLEHDTDSLWAAATGDSPRNYNAVLRIYAGYDETGVWQEFGEMKFNSRDDIPPEWGNPNPDKPRWVVTRYVDWTSWLAGAQLWGLSSIRQGESSGTITHELGHHAFRIPDLNNNPYVKPYRRVAAGPWDMMDRGSFNGPGGPHRRWVVPPTQGAAMPAGLMLRNRLANGFLTDDQILMLSRDGLAKSGLAVADVTARAVAPPPGTFAGVTVRLDGPTPQDHTPPDDPAKDPLSAGRPDYNFYSLEVVQRLGYDSFTPDHGVLIAKNKDSNRGMNGGPNQFNSFIWVIDAHPEDIHEVDYVKPNGEKVWRTIADYRQLNDALFHAGLRSGSQYEWEDAPNRLHFYVVGVHEGDRGVLSYTLAVRSLDGSGPQQRGVSLEAPARADARQVTFTLRNTGKAVTTDPALHPRDVNAFLTSDVYRLSASVEGRGWTAEILDGLAAVRFGESRKVTVYLARGAGSAPAATVRLTATSESDPSKTATATYRVSG